MLRFRRDGPQLDETGVGTQRTTTAFKSSRRSSAPPGVLRSEKMIMDQTFVYHPLNRTTAPRARATSAKLVVSEYLAYLTMLSAAVVIAIITFAYAANLTVHWLNKMSGPEFFSSEASPVSHPDVKPFAPSKVAMLSAR